MMSEVSHFRKRMHWKRRYNKTATVLAITNL